MPAKPPRSQEPSGSSSASGASRLRPAQRNPFRSLLSTAPPGEEMADVRLLPLDLIDPNPYQARQAFEAQGLQELASSIREHGVIEPIVVRRSGERYEIVAGERRHRASAMAGEASIPARIMDLDSESAAIITAVENLQREDLDIEDEARQFAFLLEATGLSQRKLAAKLGVQFNYLSRRVRLLKRPDLMEEYRSGRSTLHQVISMLDTAGDDGSEDVPGAEMAGKDESQEGAQELSGETVSAGYTSQAGMEFGEVEVALIEREDLPGFIVSRGYSGLGGYESGADSNQGLGTGGNSRSGRGAGGGPRGGARFRWRPVQQFYNWVGRTRVSDIPADERASMKAQLVQIKDALEKQLAELDQLGSQSDSEGQDPAAPALEEQSVEEQEVEGGH